MSAFRVERLGACWFCVPVSSGGFGSRCDESRHACVLYFHILKASTCKVVDSLSFVYKLIGGVGTVHMMSISAAVMGGVTVACSVHV